MNFIYDNDDLDMCCGNRPNIEKIGYGLKAECGICGDKVVVSTVNSRVSLMVLWNKRKRDEVKP